tara:strand:- start:198 stop:365 length:168 start_codon:yes stop_codon:yes gene_type:complete
MTHINRVSEGKEYVVPEREEPDKVNTTKAYEIFKTNDGAFYSVEDVEAITGDRIL